MDTSANLTPGDKDLEPFLKPKLKQASSNLKAMEFDIKRRSENEGTTDVCGVRVWNAIHSDVWRIRDAATEAFIDMILSDKGIPPRY